jgi:hypothetical protein
MKYVADFSHTSTSHPHVPISIKMPDSSGNSSDSIIDLTIPPYQQPATMSLQGETSATTPAVPRLEKTRKRPVLLKLTSNKTRKSRRAAGPIRGLDPPNSINHSNTASGLNTNQSNSTSTSTRTENVVILLSDGEDEDYDYDLQIVSENKMTPPNNENSFEIMGSSRSTRQDDVQFINETANVRGSTLEDTNRPRFDISDSQLFRGILNY